MAKTTEKYEVLYVLNPNLSEEETQAVVEKFKTLREEHLPPITDLSQATT